MELLLYDSEHYGPFGYTTWHFNQLSLFIFLIFFFYFFAMESGEQEAHIIHS